MRAMMHLYKVIFWLLPVSLMYGTCKIAGAQPVLMTYATFQRSLQSLKDYRLMLDKQHDDVMEAMLTDVHGDNILLQVKELDQCESYQNQGRKVNLADREVYIVEAVSFTVLSAVLPEYLACIQITTNLPQASDKLCGFFMLLPFVTTLPGESFWPEAVTESCQIPGKLIWSSTPNPPEGFSLKVVAEIEPTHDTFRWLTNPPCGCKNLIDFFDCEKFVLVWQQGKIGEIFTKAQINERLRFAYYLK